MISVDFINGEDQIIANEHLYQWDTKQDLKIEFEQGLVSDIKSVMVHFANKFSEQAMVVAPYVRYATSDGIGYAITVEIPNSLLETSAPIVAYLHYTQSNEQKTIKMVSILVEPRKKPNDYVSEQDHIYTLETLRAEIREWLNELDAEREADYQNFKNQIKQDIQTLIVEQTKPDATEYEYVSNTKVKYNSVTYTVEKDTTTGLIKKITSDRGNTITSTINAGVTDVTLHNAVFWATAMSSCTRELNYTGMTILPFAIESTSICKDIVF